MSICLIGGSSTLGQELIKQAEIKHEDIVATYYKNPIETSAKLVRLDLRNSNNISSFKPKDVHHLIFLQGLLSGKTLGYYDNETIEQLVSVNLTSTLQVINNLMANHCFAKPALISFVASIAAVKGSYDVAYAATKSALIGCVKSIAKNNAPDIRANVICPGLLSESGMFNAMSSEDHKRHLKQTPTKKFTKIKDLAEIILKINEPVFSNLNGAVINLDGGRYI